MVLVAACNGAILPSKATVPANPTRAPITLVLWHTQIGPARAQLNAFTTDFQKQYPWINFRIEAKSNEGDILRQGIAAIALNQPPDLIVTSPRTIADLARRNALVSLDPFLDNPNDGLTSDDRNDFLPGALDAGRFAELKNQLFAFPFDERAIVLYYNADLLKAAKFTVAPRTWDEFGNAARTLTRGDVRGWAMVPDAAVFYAFVFSRGGNVLNDGKPGVAFNGAAGLKSLQLMAALTRGGSAYLAESAAGARTDFAQGNAAFLFGSTDDQDAVSMAMGQAHNPFQWGMVSIPQDDPDRPFTTLFGSNIGIFKSSPEREQAAWLFTRWLATPEQTARWARASLAIPVRLSARALATDNSPSTSFINMVDPLPTGRAAPTINNASSIDQAIVEMWASVANGTDPATAMNGAVTRANRVLGVAP